jgi:flagellar hook-basal body complex protein FliE
MNEIAAIAAVGQSTAVALTDVAGHASNVLPKSGPDFASILSSGVANMEVKVAKADRMVTSFALDDNVPVHQVTIALEEARLAVEYAIQVRQRLVEGYRELMNLQL